MWRDPFDVDDPGHVVMCDSAGPHRDYSTVWCQLCKASWRLDDGDRHEADCTFAEWYTHLDDYPRPRTVAVSGRSSAMTTAQSERMSSLVLAEFLNDAEFVTGYSEGVDNWLRLYVNRKLGGVVHDPGGPKDSGHRATVESFKGPIG